MLKLKEPGRRYAKPIFAPSVKSSKSYEFALRFLAPVYEMPGPEKLQFADSRETSLEDIANEIDLRDELAYRKLKGDQLSRREELILKAVNGVLEQLLPKPKPLPKDILDTINEVLRQDRK